jgi:hypothetical protein
LVDFLISTDTSAASVATEGATEDDLSDLFRPAFLVEVTVVVEERRGILVGLPARTPVVLDEEGLDDPALPAVDAEVRIDLIGRDCSASTISMTASS